MRHLIRLPLAGAVCVLAFACGGETASPKVEAPTFAVSDGAHNGNPDFFFLPPLFKSPVNNPNYEPNAANLNLRPSVEICELGAFASDGSRECIAGAPLKRFAPSEVTVSQADQLYQVNWKTDETPLDVGKFYRIRVLVGASLLGFADVDPVSSGRDLKNVQTNEYIALQDGRTLPIKFRIESGALCAVDGTPCSSETITLAEGGQLELFGAGEDFRVDIPAGTIATYGNQTITEVTFNLELCAGIDVDLPLYGPCLRISTYFTGTGSEELAFSKNLLISLCELDEQYHTPDETRQEGLITLHQQDGTLVRALPHAVPNCGDGTIGFSGWQWLRQLAARLLTPKSAFAATRTTALHVGGGGETGVLGAKCSPSGSAVMRGIMMAQVCPPSSPRAQASGPQRAATATFTPALTISDFQFALPAKMDYLNPADAQRSAAPGTALPTAVKVTDLDDAPVQGATVRFIEPAIEGPGTVVGTAVSDANGIAQILWTIDAGPNTVVATGRGIAAQNNYPGGVVRPFLPDIAKPTSEQQAVALGTGRVFFFATGGQADLIIESLTHSPAEPTSVDLMEFGVTVKNQGTAATGPFYVIVTTTKDGALLETTTLVGLATEGSSLAAGESRTLCCWRATRAAGEYVQTAVADFHSNPDLNNQVPESNEENNTRSDSYTVSQALGSLEFLQQPTNTPSGLAISPALQIRVLDPAGNPVTDVVRVTVGNDPANPAECLVLQTSTLALNGIATLDNVRVNGMCTGARVAAVAGSEYRPAFSVPFDITAPPVDLDVNFPQGTDVTLESSVPYTATVTNNGGSLAGVGLQASIVQGTTTRAAGGALMHDCSATSGDGELPPGPCSIDRVLVASNEAAGVGTLVPGPATARITVQWSGVAIAVFTTPITIVAPGVIGAPIRR